MKKLFLAAAVLALASFGFAMDAQLSVHDINVNGAQQGCKSCHVPHGGAIAGDTTQSSRNTVWGAGVTSADSKYDTGTNKLWDKVMSMGSYQTYSSDNVAAGGLQAPTTSNDPAWHSYLCFSCHDGTVASVNIPSGVVATDNFLMNGGNGDTDLTNDHPVDVVFPVNADYELVGAVTGGTSGFNGQKMPLYNGKIECATCHNPHLQAIVAGTLGTGYRGNFLRVGAAGAVPTVSDNTSLCRTCHASKR